MKDTYTAVVKKSDDWWIGWIEARVARIVRVIHPPGSDPEPEGGTVKRVPPDVCGHNSALLGLCQV